LFASKHSNKRTKSVPPPPLNTTWRICSAFVIVYGYFSNIYKLTQTDFEPNYKKEVFRAVGVVLPPVGIIVGYIDFEQTSQKE